MVYVFLADGFEEIEALTPVDIMRRADIEVKTVALDSLLVRGAHGIEVRADITIEQLDMNKCTMLVLPGGKGHINLKNSIDVIEKVKYAYNNGIYIAAICASPSIIGELGMLVNKRGTCFPGYEKQCKGMIKSDKKAVTDGKIITACGAGASNEFGYEIVKALVNEKKANEVLTTMQAK